MSKTTILLLCGVLLLIVIALPIQHLNSQSSQHGFHDVVEVLDKETYVYNAKKNLAMDVYSPKDGKVNRPLVLFIHGGGFSSGSRDGQLVEEFTPYVTQKGYVLASISYTLYMKGKSFHCDQLSSEKIKAFELAADDIRTAYHYIEKNSDKLKIDPSKVVLMGSSAGAEAMLYEAFRPEKTNASGTQASPNYAGFISLAGAMIDTTLIKKDNLKPMLLYHGTCDALVPYASAPHHYCSKESPGGLLLHGPASITKRYGNLGGSYYLHTFCQGGHEIANTPMQHFQTEIVSFIDGFVLQQAKDNVHVISGTNDSACQYGRYSFCQK
ncbi:MAG: alpha/beta hydrolase [Bacteroidota bacterium]